MLLLTEQYAADSAHKDPILFFRLAVLPACYQVALDAKGRYRIGGGQITPRRSYTAKTTGSSQRGFRCINVSGSSTALPVTDGTTSYLRGVD